MNKTLKLGQKLYILIVFIDVIYHIVVTAYIHYNIINDEKTTLRITKLVFSVLLMLFTYYGSRFAKWFLVAFFVFSGVFSLSQIDLKSSISIFINIWNILFPCTILFFNPIVSFLDYQNTKNQ